MAWSDMQAKKTMEKANQSTVNTKPTWCDFFYLVLYICIVLHYTKLYQDANSSNSLVAAICVSHHLLCIPRVSVTSLVWEIPTTSHLRNKLGLSQREIERTEGVRSQRDLHLLCGIAQLALHRHNLHNSFTIKLWIQIDGPEDIRKQSANMHRDIWSFRQKQGQKLPCLGYWKNFHP